MSVCRGCYRPIYNFGERIENEEYCIPCKGTNKERDSRLRKGKAPNKFEQAISYQILDTWRSKARNIKNWPNFKLTIQTR